MPEMKAALPIQSYRQAIESNRSSDFRISNWTFKGPIGTPDVARAIGSNGLSIRLHKKCRFQFRYQTSAPTYSIPFINGGAVLNNGGAV